MKMFYLLDDQDEPVTLFVEGHGVVDEDVFRLYAIKKAAELGPLEDFTALLRNPLQQRWYRKREDAEHVDYCDASAVGALPITAIDMDAPAAAEVTMRMGSSRDPRKTAAAVQYALRLHGIEPSLALYLVALGQDLEDEEIAEAFRRAHGDVGDLEARTHELITEAAAFARGEGIPTGPDKASKVVGAANLLDYATQVLGVAPAIAEALLFAGASVGKAVGHAAPTLVLNASLSPKAAEPSALQEILGNAFRWGAEKRGAARG